MLIGGQLAWCIFIMCTAKYNRPSMCYAGRIYLTVNIMTLSYDTSYWAFPSFSLSQSLWWACFCTPVIHRSYVLGFSISYLLPSIIEIQTDTIYIYIDEWTWTSRLNNAMHYICWIVFWLYTTLKSIVTWTHLHWIIPICYAPRVGQVWSARSRMNKTIVILWCIVARWHLRGRRIIRIAVYGAVIRGTAGDDCIL